jgi:hypothetical protein
MISIENRKASLLLSTYIPTLVLNADAITRAIAAKMTGTKNLSASIAKEGAD